MLSRDCINQLNTAAAFIFDMDGTLIDNMHFHDQSWAQLHRELGLAFDAEHFTRLTAGRAGLEIMRELVPGVSDEQAAFYNARKESIYRALYAPHRRLIAGAAELLRYAALRSVRCGIATAAPPENIDFIVNGLAIDAHFDAVASPADGLRGKPHPDLFEHTARKLGVPAADCIAFEDSPLGIEAARRAGMRGVAVTTLVPAEHFANFDNVLAIVPDFQEIAQVLGTQ